MRQEDFTYLELLAKRRRLTNLLPDVGLHGWIRRSGNYTLAFLSFGGRPPALGIAKRNPGGDAPDDIRGRHIALARALFELVWGEEGKKGMELIGWN